MLTRPQWPHTIEDIVNSLDGIWGLVGATSAQGNLLRLERSLHEPLVYTLTEYNGNEESEILNRQVYKASQKDEAVRNFALALGFQLPQ